MRPPGPEPVEVVAYDPAWPLRFDRERARIAAALGAAALAIEHIGSTAVPGLAAKPIVDILVGVEDIERAGQAVAGLIDLGYQYVPELEADQPEQRYFRRGVPATHHVHMVATSSQAFDRHLRLRDYLRAHPEAAREYGKLKRGLALRFRLDPAAYAAGKAGFLHTVLDAARRDIGTAPS